MGLYKDAAGQLVVAATLPPGGTTVSGPASSNLVDVAPWLRGLDAGDAHWHPAGYFSGSAEDALGKASSIVNQGDLATKDTIDNSALLDNEVVTTDSILTGALVAIDPVGAPHPFAAKNTNELLVSATPTAIAVATNKIVFISFEITTTDLDPGYLQFFYKKGSGPFIGFASLDINSVQANGTQNHAAASYTLVIPYAANNTDTFAIYASATDGSGSHTWSATPGCSIQTLLTIFSAKK